MPKTYYYTPDLSLETFTKLAISGDNLMNLPYVMYPKLVVLLQNNHDMVDYLYEGKNFIIFNLE